MACLYKAFVYVCKADFDVFLSPRPSVCSRARRQKIAFNLSVRHTEAGVWRCYEGTLRQNWRLDEAGTMQLK